MYSLEPKELELLIELVENQLKDINYYQLKFDPSNRSPDFEFITTELNKLLEKLELLKGGIKRMSRYTKMSMIRAVARAQVISSIAIQNWQMMNQDSPFPSAKLISSLERFSLKELCTINKAFKTQIMLRRLIP